MLALSAFQSTFGVIVIWLVLFPLLVKGILVVIALQVMGERRQNQAYESERGGGVRH